MHVLFCSTVFFIGLPCDSTRTIKGLVKVLCLIPSCIAKLVTSTVLKLCNSRACQCLFRVSKFPMAALENNDLASLSTKVLRLCLQALNLPITGGKATLIPHLNLRLGQNSPARPQIRKPDAPRRNVWHPEVGRLGPP